MLDPLRDGAGHLVSGGHQAAALVTWVVPFWGLAKPFGLQERVFMTVEWADGQRAEEVEDYPPWRAFVPELLSGSLDWTDSPHTGHYEVVWAEGDDKVALLDRLHPAHQDR